MASAPLRGMKQSHRGKLRYPANAPRLCRDKLRHLREAIPQSGAENRGRGGLEGKMEIWKNGNWLKKHQPNYPIFP